HSRSRKPLFSYIYVSAAKIANTIRHLQNRQTTYCQLASLHPGKEISRRFSSCLPSLSTLPDYVLSGSGARVRPAFARSSADIVLTPCRPRAGEKGVHYEVRYQQRSSSVARTGWPGRGTHWRICPMAEHRGVFPLLDSPAGVA